MSGIVEGGERGSGFGRERQDDCWDDSLVGLVGLYCLAGFSD